VRTSFLKKADLIFAVSRYLKDLLLKAGMDEKRIYITASGIDYNYISSIYDSKKKMFDACFIGAIIPRKGVFDLVRAWSKVVKVKPHAKLVIIGYGSGFYYNNIKEFILHHNLQNNILMAGFVSEKEKYELLKQSKIFIFLSYLESFSQVICEALACGLPVIAYNLPVFKEFYDQSILYVNIGDVEEVATKIIELLGNEDLRKEMGQTGHNIAKRYDWENIAKQQIEIIKTHLQF
jgi:glycosyltransferase involved in cell wall biosynthesis